MFSKDMSHENYKTGNSVQSSVHDHKEVPPFLINPVIDDKTNDDVQRKIDSEKSEH